MKDGLCMEHQQSPLQYFWSVEGNDQSDIVDKSTTSAIKTKNSKQIQNIQPETVQSISRAYRFRTSSIVYLNIDDRLGKTTPRDELYELI